MLQFLRTDLALSHYLSGNKAFWDLRFYFSLNRNKIYVGGYEEIIACKLLTRNRLIYEEGNSLVDVIYFTF